MWLHPVVALLLYVRSFLQLTSELSHLLWALASYSGAMSTETLKINDGTTMEIARLPDIDDATWAEARGLVSVCCSELLQAFAPGFCLRVLLGLRDLLR